MNFGMKIEIGPGKYIYVYRVPTQGVTKIKFGGTEIGDTSFYEVYPSFLKLSAWKFISQGCKIRNDFNYLSSYDELMRRDSYYVTCVY